jgi:hypothetical protein
MYVRARVVLRGFKSSKELVALVDTEASMTVADSLLADEVGVEFTGKERVLVTASGHKLVGRVPYSANKYSTRFTTHSTSAHNVLLHLTC